MTLLSIAFLAFSQPTACSHAEPPKWVEAPTQLQAPAVIGFLHHWNSHNPNSKPWAWFLCIEGPNLNESEVPPFLEPPLALMEQVGIEFNNVYPLSQASPVPPEWPAYIVHKLSKVEGAYLRLGLARQINPTKWVVSVSFLAGSHYGGGFQVTVVYKNTRWTATNVKSTFVA